MLANNIAVTKNGNKIYILHATYYIPHTTYHILHTTYILHACYISHRHTTYYAFRSVQTVWGFPFIIKVLGWEGADIFSINMYPFNSSLDIDSKARVKSYSREHEWQNKSQINIKKRVNLVCSGKMSYEWVVKDRVSEHTKQSTTQIKR